MGMASLQLAWFDFKNDTDEVIPPFSVVVLIGDHTVARQSTPIV